LTSKTKSRVIVTLFLLSAVVVSALIAWTLISIRITGDNPVSQMYRTEAELRAIQTAIETYYKDKGEYPPAGNEGLVAAMQHLPRNVDYLPESPPLDDWGQVFVYVPHTAYDVADSQAMRDENGEPFEPGGFQAYSIGLDGDAGLDNPERAEDNVLSWGTPDAWRPHYLVYFGQQDQEEDGGES
jgi:hypothetical protein